MSHFKCGNTIRHDYPELNRWMKNLYWKNEAFSSTTDFHHIKVGFCSSQGTTMSGSRAEADRV